MMFPATITMMMIVIFFSDEVTEFSLTFYTTVEFEEQTDDIPLFVDTAIADMNRSYLENYDTKGMIKGTITLQGL